MVDIYKNTLRHILKYNFKFLGARQYIIYDVSIHTI